MKYTFTLVRDVQPYCNKEFSDITFYSEQPLNCYGETQLLPSEPKKQDIFKILAHAGYHVFPLCFNNQLYVWTGELRNTPDIIGIAAIPVNMYNRDDALIHLQNYLQERSGILNKQMYKAEIRKEFGELIDIWPTQLLPQPYEYYTFAAQYNITKTEVDNAFKTIC
jgi:hypothetical protein